MKKITRLVLSISLITFLSNVNSFAQFTNVWMQQYRHTVTNGYSTESRKIVQDASGFIYVLTDNTSDLDSNSVPSGSTHHYAVVSKYTPSGAKLHRRVIEVFNHVTNGFDNPGAFGLEVDASANIYVGYTPYSAAGSYNVAIAKYDSSLMNRLWVSQYGTSANDQGVDMKLAASGMVYFVTKTINGGNTTYAVQRTNSGGAPTTCYTFPNSDVITSLALGSNEDMYLTGYRLSGINKALLMAGIDKNLLLLKWLGTYNGGFAGDDVGNMVTVGADGNVYFVGTSTQHLANGTDIVIIKHSANVNTKVTWACLQHHDDADQGLFISVPNATQAFVAGVSGNEVILYRLDITTLPPPMSPGIFKANPMTAHSTINGISLNAMKVSTSGRVYITGGITATDLNGQTFSALYLAKYSVLFGNVLSMSYESSSIGEYTSNYKGVGLSLDYGKTDIYMLCDNWNNNSNHLQEYSQLYDMDVSSPLREAGLQKISEISVYPNPVRDIMKVYAGSAISSVEIIDMTGQSVRTIYINGTEAELNLGDLPEGIYICKVALVSGENSIRKIIVD